MTHHHLSINNLMQVIKEYKDKPFEWGLSDCCMFIADCCVASVNIDPAENHRGKYSTEMGAKRALKKYGSIESSLDKYFDRVDVNNVKRGDIVMYESELGKTMGIHWNFGVLTPGETGLISVDCEPLVVWRVA